MANTTNPPRKRSNTAKTARSLAKKNLKISKTDTINTLVAEIMEEKASNSWTRFPHSYISDIIGGLKEESLWLTRNVVSEGMRNFIVTSVITDNNLEKQHVLDSSMKY